ncbi:MAG: hypothetical protein ACSLE1_10255 [Sphingobium sp.]
MVASPMALAACSDNSTEDGVSGVTAGEARALNEAAEMLDKRPVSPAATNAAD